MDEHEFMRLLGSNIRSSRVQLGMTQGELAKRIGRSIASVSKYERGECAIDSYTLCTIAEILSVSTSRLLPEKKLTASPLSADSHWNPIAQYNSFYLHNVGFISQKLCCSFIEIDWQTNDVVMYVDIGKPYKDYVLTNMTLYGKVYATGACTNIYVSNPIAPIDYFHVVINSADWYAGKQVCHVSYSTVDWRCVASKGVLTTTQECPDGIEELLAFTKEELKEIKKKNQVLF